MGLLRAEEGMEIDDFEVAQAEPHRAKRSFEGHCRLKNNIGVKRLE